MTDIWQSFLPLHVIQDLLAWPEGNPTRREQRFEAVVLFADVSGFTAISEALGKTGKSGTEELTHILNSYFEPMISLIQMYGGVIGKFGGDAMTVLFPYNEGSRVRVARQGLQCAVDMQSRMSAYTHIPTSAGNFGLAMKAGLAAGAVFCTSVGDPAVRLEYIIAGEPLDRAAEAEHHAAKGEVVCSQELLDLAGEVEKIEARGEFASFGRVLRTVAITPLPTPQAPPVHSEILYKTIQAYLHPSLVERVKANQVSFINEHRKVTVLFISFSGFDYAQVEVQPRLQDYLSRVIEIVYRYDGYLNKVDMGDKGSKIVVVFGAPITHEDDVDRALHCALEIRALPDVPVRTGANTGFVFCGLVGSSLRQEYTVMGDVVNLSARLMQAAAENQIIVSDATRSAARSPFAWESSASIRVKGKGEEVAIHLLKEARRRSGVRLQEPQYTLPMVGRQAEMELIRERILRALQGAGQIIGVSAEAGMGKSRLAAEVIKLALEQGMSGFAGECLSHASNTSYLPWRGLLRGLFELDGNQSAEKQIAELQNFFYKMNPTAAGRIPLLSVALNLPIPDNELTQAMDAKLRKESLEALVVECIQRQALAEPTLLVFEDCHWIDPLSNDLLEAVARNIASLPVLMLVIYRPPESERIQPRVTRFSHFTAIRLTEFTRQEAERLIGLKLQRLFGQLETAPEELVERITARAQGNPFYIDEMINLIQDRGINLRDVEAIQALELPESLHSLIISRVDQLQEEAKTTLKVASVIGRTFRANWLWNIYPELGAPEQVREQLLMLNRLEITPLDKPEPELEYIFKHIVTREVAYESISVATRKMLHEQTARYIEHAYAQDIDRLLDLLAYHYGLSNNLDKQRQYYARAGKAAQEAYANEAAADYFRRLLPLQTGKAQVESMLKLGEIWRLTGKWQESAEISRQAWESASLLDERLMLARGEQALGQVALLRGAFGEALEWLSKASQDFAGQSNLGLAETTLETGILHWSQGDLDRALECFEKSLNLAKQLGDQRSILRAMGNIGAVHAHRSDHARALEWYAQGRSLAEAIGDRPRAGLLTGNQGAIYLDMGDYQNALACFTRFLQNSLEVGYRQGISASIGNVGQVYANQGYYDEASACFLKSLQISLEIGDRVGVGDMLRSLAEAYAGRATALPEPEHAQLLRKALDLLDQAILCARLLDTPYELAFHLQEKAKLLAQMGDWQPALEVNAEALQLAQEMEHEILFEVRLRELALRCRLDYQSCTQTIAEIESLLAEWQANDQAGEIETALAAYTVWSLDHSQEAYCQQAAELYSQLYAETPDVKFNRQYQELTDQALPAPPPLGPLPAAALRNPPLLEKLLRQVQALIEEIKTESAEKGRSVS